MKILLIIAGSILVGIGVIGIIVPGLPSTIFFLLAASCYIRSSDRLYNWIINHPVFGKQIKFYRIHRAMPLKAKVMALSMMWPMIMVSSVFFIHNIYVKLIVILAGVVGTLVILRIKTYREATGEYR